MKILDSVNYLKSSTSDAHLKLHSNKLLGQLMSKEITLSEYREIIQKFHQLYLSMFESLFGTEFDHSFLKVTIEKLELDIQALGIKENSSEDLCLEIKNYDDYLGLKYVLEGSKLGAIRIRENLFKCLELDRNSGMAFYCVDDQQTKLEWMDFIKHLEESHSSIETVTNKALEVFSLIDTLFSSEDKS
ncbi:MAG: hypothetical protein HRT47_09760 [Candidatus Caenarcaniphilales bacterium]|nr:hypothetical protein [Candidatus Caenarcaniphilales bacterium]